MGGRSASSGFRAETAAAEASRREEEAATAAVAAEAATRTASTREPESGSREAMARAVDTARWKETGTREWTLSVPGGSVKVFIAHSPSGRRWADIDVELTVPTYSYEPTGSDKIPAEGRSDRELLAEAQKEARALLKTAFREWR